MSRQWPCDDREWAERQAADVEEMQCRRSHDERIATEWDSIQLARARVERAEVELREFFQCRMDLEMLAHAVASLCEGECPKTGNHPVRSTCWWCVSRARALAARNHWKTEVFLERREKAWAECNAEKARQANAS